jgi:hypothetical protein
MEHECPFSLEMISEHVMISHLVSADLLCSPSSVVLPTQMYNLTVSYYFVLYLLYYSIWTLPCSVRIVGSWMSEYPGMKFK